MILPSPARFCVRSDFSKTTNMVAVYGTHSLTFPSCDKQNTVESRSERSGRHAKKLNRDAKSAQIVSYSTSKNKACQIAADHGDKLVWRGQTDSQVWCFGFVLTSRTEVNFVEFQRTI